MLINCFLKSNFHKQQFNTQTAIKQCGIATKSMRPQTKKETGKQLF